MSGRFDVAARLAEGRPAVEHTQIYVQACHALGYQHPDLTAHGSQVRDWYDSEAGLDLKVLDDDIAELRVAVNTIEEALWVQRAQLTELAAAWRGPGADSAARFLQRHCDAAATVVAHVRAAAEGCAALRDDVWQSVDGKVATAIAVDERRLGERPAWLAAAHTVTAGAGDRSAAEELIRQHVTPYVDNDIRGDWLTAMHTAEASVTASYDAAIHALTSAPEACFDVPGDLGPTWQPVFDDPPRPSPVAQPMPPTSPPVDPVPTMPAAASAPPPAPTAEAPQPLPAEGFDTDSSLPPELATPLGDAGGLSSGAGGLGGIAGSIGGVVGKIVDGIGGLLGSLADGFSDPSGSGDSLVDDPFTADDADKADDPDDKPDDPDDTEKPDDQVEPASTDNAAEKPAESIQPAADTEPAAPPGPPPPIDALPAEPPPAAGQSAPAAQQPDASTPCEIAEDELPQAGQ
ncbi:MAG TPA: hypothetical protein VE400_04395 [Mycobacterium sp.]|jgi:hypothetical protein|nr:hypothetical protein [Mycobacterium sp.]